jgi:hypothetical protein
MLHHHHHHHRHHNRRQFLTRSIFLPSLIYSFSANAQNLLDAQSGGARTYDLLIRGGRVIDPSQDLAADADVAIRQGKIARIAGNIAESEAAQVLDARRMIVTPGLVDVHVHVYDGVAPLGIPADPNCIASAARFLAQHVSVGQAPQPDGPLDQGGEAA